MSTRETIRVPIPATWRLALAFQLSGSGGPSYLQDAKCAEGTRKHTFRRASRGMSRIRGTVRHRRPTRRPQQGTKSIGP
eukprot:3895227-Prymnesium_polylepis.1